MDSSYHRDASRDPQRESSDNESIVDHKLEEARKNQGEPTLPGPPATEPWEGYNSCPYRDAGKRRASQARGTSSGPSRSTTTAGGTKGASAASTYYPGISCSSAPTRAEARGR